MVSQGRNLMVWLYGDGVNGDTDTLYPVACDISCTLALSVEFLETTIRDNGYYKTFIPTYVSYQVTGNGLTNYSKVMHTGVLMNYATLRKIVRVNMILNEVVSGATVTKIIWSGTGYFQQLQQTGDVSSALQFSYTLLITGGIDINVVTVPDPSGGAPITKEMQVYRKQWQVSTDQKTYQSDDLIGATLIYLDSEGVGLFSGDADDDMTGLDSDTGTVTWNFPAVNNSRMVLIYKK
jgi:hypothetical protein